MLNSISRSARFKLFLAFSFLVLFAAAVPGLWAQPQGQASQPGPAEAQAVAAAPTVQFSSDTYSVGEGDGTATITVTLSETYTETVTVNYATSAGTATAGSDYTETGGSLDILEGETSGTFDVPILEDAVDEDGETVNLTLSLPAGSDATLGSPSTATLTITDNDTADVIVDPTSLTVNEPSGSDTFNISLATEPTASVTIGLSTSDGSECSVPQGSAVLDSTNWDTGVDVTVNAVDDSIVDGPQSCTVQTATASSSDGNYDGTDPADVDVTVNDDDTAAIVVDPLSLTIGEPDGSDTFNISLTSEPTDSVTIGLSTSDGSECSVPQGSAVLDSANWDAGVNVTVNAVDDSIVDGPQSCTVQTATASSSDGNYDGTDPADVDVTVNDDDTAEIIVDPLSLTIGEPTGSDTFNIRLTSRPSNPVNIGLSTSSAECNLSTGTATLNSSNWDTGVNVTVTAVNDDVADGPQPCDVVTAAATSNDGSYDGTDPDDVSVTVNDDDTASIVVDPTSLTISEPTGFDTFNIRLTSEPTASVTIGVSKSGTECTLSTNQVMLHSGNWSAGADVTVTAVDDVFVDGARSCPVTTAPAVSGDTTYDAMDPDNVAVTVNDDDSTTVQFSSSSYTVGEGAGPAVITVTLTSPSISPVTVTYGTSDGTARVIDGDYTAANGPLVFDPGQTSKTFNVPITDDGIDEDNETVNLALSAPDGAGQGAPSTATLTILDNDLAPTVQFSSNRYFVDEDVGTTNVNVTLSAASERPVTVHLASSDGSPPATGGVDYTVITDTLTFDPGVTSIPYPVSILDDLSNERDERIDLSLSTATNATLGTPNPAEVIISDNDDPPTVQFSNATYSVNEDGVSATITATLSTASGFVVTVDYATVAGGTATPGSDYTAENGTLVFTAGQVSKTFDVPINDDLLDEVNETVNLALSNPNNATLDPLGSDAVLTIIDNEGAPTVQFTPATFNVTEGLTATISVGLSAASERTVTATYTTGDGTATVASGDYVATSGTLTFAPGELNKTFAVRTLADSVVEGDETVNLTLTNPINAQLGVPNDTAVLTIVDPGQATVQFSQANFNVPETALTGNVTVTLSTVSALTVTVNYTMTDGTATAGDDYALSSGTLTFAPGQTSRTISVSLFTDQLDEGDETILLKLSSPGNAALGVPANGTLTILDDDLPPSVQFGNGNYVVSEADGAVNVTVQLSGEGSGRIVTVDYATVDGSAKAGSDYGVISGTLVFNPGEASKTISVPIVDDDVDEPNETFVLLLTNAGNATLGVPDSVTVTIFDSDLPIFTYYHPIVFYDHVIGEPNDSCGTAYPIQAGRPYSFLPDDENDWYQFDLTTSGNLIVEVTNFVPIQGQVAVYKGDSCASVIVLGNYGFDNTTKTVNAGLQTAGHYYIYVSNDGVLNDATPYQLYVRFP